MSSICDSCGKWVCEFRSGIGDEEKETCEFYVDRDELTDAIAKKILNHLVVHCKDCKYYPTVPEDAENGFDYIWPEDSWKCPFRCDDEYYSRVPREDFYCANGVRKG